MKTADVEKRRAEDDVRYAVVGILTRERCRIADALALEIHQAYTGRGWHHPVNAYCPTHPSIMKPCPLCPRTPEESDDA